MTTLKEITLPELAFHIENAFQGDDMLLRKYHIVPGLLEDCVKNTLDLICENAGFYKEDIKFYAIDHYGKPIGFTVIVKNDPSPHELYSFGINKKYRTAEIKQEWLKEVRKILGSPYYIVLWSKNTRAIQFFQKQGFSVLRNSKYLNDETKTLIICQQAV